MRGLTAAAAVSELARGCRWKCWCVLLFKVAWCPGAVEGRGIFGGDWARLFLRVGWGWRGGLCMFAHRGSQQRASPRMQRDAHCHMVRWESWWTGEGGAELLTGPLWATGTDTSTKMRRSLMVGSISGCRGGDADGLSSLKCCSTIQPSLYLKFQSSFLIQKPNPTARIFCTFRTSSSPIDRVWTLKLMFSGTMQPSEDYGSSI